MRTIAKLLLLAALLLEAFAYWGMCTAGGVQAFDEMDGLIPFFAGLLGLACAVSGGVLYWIARRRAKRQASRR